MTDAQTRYDPAKLEMFAILKMVEKFAPHLTNRRFLLRADQRALLWLQANAGVGALAARWVARLEGFRFQLQEKDQPIGEGNSLGEAKEPVEVKALTSISERDRDCLVATWKEDSPKNPPLGAPNVNRGATWTKEEMGSSDQERAADTHGSSQRPRTQGEEEEEEREMFPLSKITRTPPRYTVELLRDRQRLDPLCSLAARALEWPSDAGQVHRNTAQVMVKDEHRDWLAKNQYRLRLNDDAVLILDPERPSDRPKLVIPQCFRKELIQRVHEFRSHRGEEDTRRRLLKDYEWPGIEEEVREFVRGCAICGKRESPKKVRSGPEGAVVARGPGELLVVDFQKMVRARDGSAGLLTLTDQFSDYCVAAAIENFKPSEVARIIWRRWVQLCGIPDVVHTGRGADFEDEILQELLVRLGATRIHSSGCYSVGKSGPQTGTEFFVATCVKRASEEDPRGWPEHVVKVIMNYNMTRNELTGYSPFRLMHGREARTPLSLVLPAIQKANPRPTADIVRDQVADMARVAGIVREELQISQVRRAS